MLPGGQRNAGRHAEQQREAKGDGRQRHELRTHAHRKSQRHAQHAPEVLQARVQRNAEHQKSQHRIEGGQRSRVEVQADLVDRQHGKSPGCYRKACAAARTALR
jgi:hypothetical protein